MAKKLTKKIEEVEDDDLPLENDLDDQNKFDDEDFETTIIEPDEFIILDDFDEDEDDDY